MEIAIVILELARNGIQKTRLVYRTNFNHTLMQKYLDYLMEKNLIEIVNTSRPVYHTTEQGIELLEQFSKVREVLGMQEVIIDEMFRQLSVANKIVEFLPDGRWGWDLNPYKLALQASA